MFNGSLVAGGSFQIAGGTLASRVARWDGSTWTALGSGVSGPVNALVTWNGALYAGGAFTTAGGVTVNGIARWDGSTWTGLGTGMSGESSPGSGMQVLALAVHDGALYAAGSFDHAGGVPALGVARWDGSNWAPLGSGISGTLYALADYGGSLIVGGRFTSAGGTPANHIARWDGTVWNAMGSGMNGYEPAVLTLMVWNEDLYAGGEFGDAGGVQALDIARWNGVSWSAVGAGLNGWVTGIGSYGGALVATGSFISPGGNIARWNGSSWTPLGSGLLAYNICFEGYPCYVGRSLFNVGNDLVVGGPFIAAGGKSSYGIARWNDIGLADAGPAATRADRPRLSPAAPNPAPGPIDLAFTLPRAAHARILVHDLRGALVNVVLDSPRSAGTHHVVWDRRDRRGAAVASGVYLVTLEAEDARASDRIVVIR
jgi:hypothetical protein